MRAFFGSIWFKCITTLLIIIAISGGLLAVLSNVLYVSDAERTDRAIKKLYGGELKEYTTVFDVSQGDEAYEIENEGSITKLFKVSDQQTNDYLFCSTGYDGYKGGTITVWVKVSIVDEADKKFNVTKVLLESFTKQTLMSKLDDKFYGGFEFEDVTERYDVGMYFSSKQVFGSVLNVSTGATASSRAGCNAVNIVINYVGGIL